MVEQAIHFNDGNVCERTMGVWSRLAGEFFLDWLRPRPGMQWLDVGCGSGALTELLVQRCAPAETQGIEPIAGERQRHRVAPEKFRPARRWPCACESKLCFGRIGLGSGSSNSAPSPPAAAQLVATVIWLN